MYGVRTVNFLLRQPSLHCAGGVILPLVATTGCTLPHLAHSKSALLGTGCRGDIRTTVPLMHTSLSARAIHYLVSKAKMCYSRTGAAIVWHAADNVVRSEAFRHTMQSKPVAGPHRWSRSGWRGWRSDMRGC